MIDDWGEHCEGEEGAGVGAECVAGNEMVNRDLVLERSLKKLKQMEF